MAGDNDCEDSIDLKARRWITLKGTRKGYSWQLCVRLNFDRLTSPPKKKRKKRV